MKALAFSALSWASRLSLAAFFAFVGYWKASGPMAALAEHGAWVAGFPEWFARAVGASELACAAALLAEPFVADRRVASWGAPVLILNQAIALGVHAARGEAAQAAPQNLFIITLLVIVIASPGRRRNSP